LLGVQIPKPHVCIVCDSFIKPSDLCLVPIKQLRRFGAKFIPLPNSRLHPNLIQQYSITPVHGMSASIIRVLSQSLLSPRAVFVEKYADVDKNGYTCCKPCYKILNKKCAEEIPKFCIANNYAFGLPPPELLDLSDIELAMIAPVKVFGFCFTYTGGVQMQLKGSLSYYKIGVQSNIENVAQLEAFGLKQHVVILIYGSMTEQQNKKARNKAKIRTNKIICAVQWLLQNRKDWSPLQNYHSDIINKIKAPILMDTSTRIIGSASASHKSVEASETFQVYYPDGTVSTLQGGQENIDEFMNVVKEATDSGYDLQLRLKTLSEAVHDYKDNNLVNSCNMQFPYGRVGLKEDRVQKDGSLSDFVDITEFTKYLSMISIQHFQSELFTLILYNMQLKHIMVRHATWKV
jgi:hypothetical protein